MVTATATRGRRPRARPTRDAVLASAKSYARGVGGAILVGTPLLYTMEMWWSGFVLPPHRVLVFYLASFLVLVALEHYSGFRDEGSFLGEVVDAVEALGIGTVVAAMLLALTGVFDRGLAREAVLVIVILESVPLAIGASVAISLLHGGGERGGDGETTRAERKKRKAGFWGKQLIGIAGALYFGFNVAPTEEPMMIGLRMAWWQAATLLALSLLVVHALLYAVDFRGGERLPHGRGWWRTLVGLGTASYLSAAFVALFLLWVFGRVDADTGPAAALRMTIALGFVTSIGGAAGRLII